MAVRRRGCILLKDKIQSNASPSHYSFQRTFSVLNRPQPNYDGHVPLNRVERGALAVGSAFGSLINPRRGGTAP